MKHPPSRSTIAAALLLASVTFASLPAAAQVRWSPATTGPAARHAAAAAYDPLLGALVVFGGRGAGNQLFDDTWTFDGQRWQQVLTATRPPAMADAAMAHCSRNGLVLFGGSDGRAYDRTWVFNGSSWRQLFPFQVPPARERHVMASWGTQTRSRCVMFGGVGVRSGGAPNFLGDTWEWNGNDWAQIASAGATPSPRSSSAMDFDALTRTALLFGGQGAAGTLGDTWRLDTNGWQQLSPATMPPSRYGAGLAFDAARERWVLFGGSHNGVDVFEWAGTDWLQRTVGGLGAPAGRRAAVWQYDEARRVVRLFGGLSANQPLGDHAEYAPVTAGVATEIGGECTNSTGLNSRLYMQLPWRGEPTDIRLTNVPVPGVALVAIGGPSQVFNGILLPIDGGPLGMPGCSIRVAPAGFVPFPVTTTGRGTLSTWTIIVPPSLTGSFRMQAAILDPAAGNLAGIVLSNAVSFAPGDK